MMMKDTIEKMVKREIEDILGESRASIKGMVRASLLPELRTAIRNEIHQALDELVNQVPENPEKPMPSAPPPFEKSENAVIRHPSSAKGLYLYCIADAGESVNFGSIGIDGNAVYTIPFRDLSAVVHDCTAKPYQSDDPEKVKQWVLTHQQVLDGAAEKFGTIIPMGFDTIICGKGDADPNENMQKWIESDYETLASKMAKIRNRAEYGVQVFWETGIMARNVSENSVEMKALEEEIRTKPKGIAYMYRQKLAELLKNELARMADQCFQEFYEKIKVHVEDLTVEKTKISEEEGKQMLLNLSCLLSKEQSGKLGETLEAIDNRDGFSVRYTGPWPPYSFV